MARRVSVVLLATLLVLLNIYASSLVHGAEVGTPRVSITSSATPAKASSTLASVHTTVKAQAHTQGKAKDDGEGDDDEHPDEGAELDEAQEDDEEADSLEHDGGGMYY
eukprot:TRINITY_DN817_c0_g1_i6.p2 TRINITY_DN817_c0_g1~~TRINITY_DN817_c0_g1_i6.p2  ORF type:complete len:108 (-),score=23.94 TRINITY_DN817_c0_g1_i6:288-611(-)